MKTILFLFMTCLIVNINQIASVESNSSPDSLSAYIHKNYDILFQSPQIQQVEEADFYLLVVYHDSIGHQHIHSVLINEYAHTGDVVLIEGVPSGQPIEAKDSLQSAWIKAPVSILGWDAGWMQDLTGIDMTEIERLGSQLLQLQYEMAWHPSKGHKRQYDALVQQITPLLATIQPLFDKSFEEKIKADFPARTAAMVQSLRVVEKNQTKVFLIAGLYHLCQPAGPPFDDPNYSLAPLYEFLNEHRAVILLPKQRPTEQWNAFYLPKHTK